jgi:hypothetical protein
MATVIKLQTERGIITSQAEILKEAQDFYQSLYTEEDIFLKQTLDENQRRSCEGPITHNGLTSAAKRLKLN